MVREFHLAMLCLRATQSDGPVPRHVVSQNRFTSDAKKEITEEDTRPAANHGTAA